MRLPRVVTRTVLAIAALAALAAPALATTLIREGLEDLTRGSGMVLHGRVVDIRSYWNDDNSFIYTDVRVRPIERVKDLLGRNEDVTFTVLGGTVGDITTLVIGGPELVPGSEYVLFLAEDEVHGRRMLTMPSLVQGAFDVFRSASGVRAVSQAALLPLLPDAKGLDRAPGDVEGLDLGDMLMSVRKLTLDR
jgi:hypothetical protein